MPPPDLFGGASKFLPPSNRSVLFTLVILSLVDYDIYLTFFLLIYVTTGT